MRTDKIVRVVFIAAGILGGCGLGYNRMLFVTTTNYGLNVDSTPPTAELSIARREGVISPSFDGDITPPVLGVFDSYGNIFNPTISGVFAGGNAADYVTRPTPSAGAAPSPDGRLTQGGYSCASAPARSAVLDGMNKIPLIGGLTEEGDTARPFFFGTDTSTGLKMAWSGTTGVIPDTVKLGYNRKEFAYAPVFSAPTQPPTATVPAGAPTSTSTPIIGTTPATSSSVTPITSNGPPTCPTGEVAVKSPSFLAAILTSFNLAGMQNTGLRYVQLFATGPAANNLAQREDVRAVVAYQMIPTGSTPTATVAAPVQTVAPTPTP